MSDFRVSKSKRRLVLLFLLAGGIMFFSFYVWHQKTDPFANYGMQSLNPHEIVLEVSNEGYREIKIVQVSVNGNQAPDFAKLGVAYDSGHMVQISPEPNPEIEFMELSASPIYPKLSSHEMEVALKKKQRTPVQYGLHILHKEEPIRSVSVQYQYFGLKKKKTITRWFGE